MANIGFVKQILKFELFLFSKFNSGAAEKLPVHVSFRRACTVQKSYVKGGKWLTLAVLSRF